MVMRRPWAGAPWPERGLDLALYFGEVVYGNVGAARRLDLTIIGPTMNEASRMAALRAACGRLRFVSRPRAAGAMRPLTRSLGLSLGGRCCLALGQQRAATVLTTDSAWSQLPEELGIRTRNIRRAD